MNQREIAGPLPNSVRLAAALFAVYGVTVVLNATVMSSADSWVTAHGLPRALLRLLGTVLIAWGLLHRARWAWWLGFGLAAFWLATGALAVLVLERGDVYWLPPGGFQLPLVISELSLGLALALLLSPSARTVFRRPVA
jgi:hypothetical protein